MTKQEIIKEAWGDEYSNDVIMEGSRCGFKIIDNLEYIVKYQGGDWYCQPYTFETVAFMPKGLQEYLKNNGWKRIEGQHDLPDIDTDYWVVYKGEVTKRAFNHHLPRSVGFWTDNITHYQPIEKPKPPLY